MEPNRDVLNELSLWTAKMAMKRNNGHKSGEVRNFDIAPGLTLRCDFGLLGDYLFPTVIKVDFDRVPFDEPDDYVPIEEVHEDLITVVRDTSKHMKMGYLPHEWIPDAGFFQ